MLGTLRGWGGEVGLRSLIVLAGSLALVVPWAPVGARGDEGSVAASFTTFSNPNEILALAVDDDGVVWTAGTGGVAAWSPDEGTPRRFTVDDGLTSNLVTSITIGGDGSVWIGTWDGGVARFDGSAWSPMRWPGELPMRWVNALTTAPDGTVWAGGVTRAARGWRGAVSPLTDGAWGRPVIFKGGVRDLAVSQTGEVWAATFGKGVLRILGAQVTRFREEDGLADDLVRSVATSASGDVWFATSGGISRFDGSSWRTFRRFCQSIATGEGHEAWCGGPGPSVLHFDGVRWRRVLVALDGMTPTDGSAGDKSFAAISTIAVDPTGVVWAGTWRDGLLRLEGDAWQRKYLDDGPMRNYTTTVAPTLAGGVWAGTFGGFARYQGGSWVAREEEQDVASAEGFACRYMLDQPICGSEPWLFREILARGPSEAWALTVAGLRVVQGQGWVDVPIRSETWDGEVPIASFTLGSDGEVWAASWPVLFHGDLSGWTEMEGPPGFSWPEAIAVAPNGDIWLAASDPWEFAAGLARFDGHRWLGFEGEADIPSYPSHLAIAADGTVWVGSWREGVASFDGESWSTYPASANQRLHNLTDLAVGPDGSVWVATNGRGLSHFDGTRWQALGTSSGVASLSVNAVAVATDGTVWIGTAAGVQRLVLP